MDPATCTAAMADAMLGRYHPERNAPGYRAVWLAERERIGSHAEDTAAIIVGATMVRRAGMVPA